MEKLTTALSIALFAMSATGVAAANTLACPTTVDVTNYAKNNKKALNDGQVPPYNLLWETKIDTTLTKDVGDKLAYGVSSYPAQGGPSATLLETSPSETTQTTLTCAYHAFKTDEPITVTLSQTRAASMKPVFPGNWRQQGKMQTCGYALVPGVTYCNVTFTNK